MRGNAERYAQVMAGMSPPKVRKRRDMADSNWIDIGSDVNWQDYGGNWSRKITDTRYFVIRFENCEEWGDDETGYHIELSEVDLTAPNLSSALECCDVPADGLDEYGEPIPAEQYRLMQVYALHSYGARAPLFQERGQNVWKLVRAAKGEAHRLLRDSAEYEARMQRPVNGIGSTAREYQQGDIQSAVLRGVMNGDPRAELMLRLGVR